MGYGITSILRPDTLRRFDTPYFLRLVLLIQTQVILSRIFGALCIAFSLFILSLVIRDMVRGKLQQRVSI